MTFWASAVGRITQHPEQKIYPSINGLFQKKTSRVVEVLLILD